MSQNYGRLENAYRNKNSLMFKKLRLVTSFLSGGNKFLDIGCGTGDLLNKVKDRYIKLVGIDTNKNSIKIAKRKLKNAKNISIIRSTLEDFDKTGFDCCTALDIIEHLDDQELAINKVYRILKKRGRAVFTFPNFYDKFYIFSNTKIKKKKYAHKVSHSVFGWSNLFRNSKFEIKFVRAIDFPIIHSDMLARNFYFFGMCLLFVCEK